jgi:hypothetical protein
MTPTKPTQVEVDQSGKIGDTRVPTVLAFSDGECRAILISATVKRECYAYLRKHYRALRQPHLKVFAAALFLLLRDRLAELSLIAIDTEYTGQEAIIKGMLLEHIRTAVPNFDSEAIVFREIGKKSSAHRKAIATYRRRIKPDHVVKSEEMIALLRKQK